MPLPHKAKTNGPTSGPFLESIDVVIWANLLWAQHVKSQNG